MLQEKVTIRDTEFTVRELTVDQMMPIMALITEDNQAGQKLLMQSCIHLDGDDEPIGAALSGYPFVVFTKVMMTVLRLNGMSEEENTPEGND